MTNLVPTPAEVRRASVDLGVGGIAAAGSYFAALPVLRRLRREHNRTIVRS